MFKNLRGNAKSRKEKQKKQTLTSSLKLATFFSSWAKYVLSCSKEQILRWAGISFTGPVRKKKKKENKKTRKQERIKLGKRKKRKKKKEKDLGDNKASPSKGQPRSA